MKRASRILAAVVATIASSAGCGGGGGSASDGGCDGSCPQASLVALDVETVVAQAVGEAERLGLAATIAVVDRVGNVLAVFQMTNAAKFTVITSGLGKDRKTGGFESLVVPTTLAAISKAGTAAYLSSQGNAFTTRTAGQIVQENFNPGERGRPGGPLFGVQFSQLPCGDLVTSFADGVTGPHRMPLGFSADPGGIPLYMDTAEGGRVPVGGIGVEVGCALLDDCGLCSGFGGTCNPTPDTPEDACGAVFERQYSADTNLTDRDRNLEERIAGAGAVGFEAPSDREADRIFVDGKSLRFVDDRGFSSVAVVACEDLSGTFDPVDGYTDVSSCDEIRDGVTLGTPASGIWLTELDGVPAELLVNGTGAERFPPKDGAGLSAAEVRAILVNALEVTARTRAQIRRPLGTPARVSVSVVDTTGAILGVARSPDAPVFGIDVSLQKARAAAFFSSPSARADLATISGAVPSTEPYVDALTTFLTERARLRGEPIAAGDVLTGTIAFSNRAIGNLARPFFPDGINGNKNGPLSLPVKDSSPPPKNEWSPFSTGFQLDLVFGGVATATCSFPPPPPLPPEERSCSDLTALANGIQIFPGSVPIYRGSTLVGAIGISGDGVDQDDLIAFLGLAEASEDLGGAIGNAPKEIRADQVTVSDNSLRYVNCPVSPFVDSDEQEACDGL